MSQTNGDACGYGATKLLNKRWSQHQPLSCCSCWSALSTGVAGIFSHQLVNSKSHPASPTKDHSIVTAKDSDPEANKSTIEVEEEDSQVAKRVVENDDMRSSTARINAELRLFQAQMQSAGWEEQSSPEEDESFLMLVQHVLHDHTLSDECCELTALEEE